MKCPECGTELIKKPKAGVYECPNPYCPVIKVRVHGAGKWRGEIVIHYDSTAKRRLIDNERRNSHVEDVA